MTQVLCLSIFILTLSLFGWFQVQFHFNLNQTINIKALPEQITFCSVFSAHLASYQVSYVTFSTFRNMYYTKIAASLNVSHILLRNDQYTVLFLRKRKKEIKELFFIFYLSEGLLTSRIGCLNFDLLIVEWLRPVDWLLFRC